MKDGNRELRSSRVEKEVNEVAMQLESDQNRVKRWKRGSKLWSKKRGRNMKKG